MLKKKPASRLIVISYTIGILLIAVLLKLPISLKPGATILYVDALFTSVSAVSVTGLTTVSIKFLTGIGLIVAGTVSNSF